MSLNQSVAVQAITDAANKWMAVCNVQIVREQDTITPPQTINGNQSSPGENVIGWSDLSIPPNGAPNISGITYTTRSASNIVDSDTSYSYNVVTSPLALARVAVHEFGHALGLAHSNVEGDVMSGPVDSNNPGVPSTSYDNISTLQPDDIQGCLCLYGPSAANSGQGYACNLPAVRDFGSVPIGGSSATQQITIANSAPTGTMTINAISFSTPEFNATGGCPAGTTLAPGASCTFGVVFSPREPPGSRRDFARIDTTSLGPYQFPVTGTATGSPPQPATVDVIEFYNAGSITTSSVRCNPTSRRSIRKRSQAGCAPA